MATTGSISSGSGASTWSVSGSGLNSGINYDELTTKLMDVQRQPVKLMEDRQTAYSQKITFYTGLKTKVDAFKSSADAIRWSSKFATRTASVSDTSILDATASGNASPSSFSVTQIKQLAEAQSLANDSADAFASTSTKALSSGSTFQFTINGEQKTITATSDMSVQQLADAINSQGYTGTIQVQAAVLKSTADSKYYLTLTSNTPGSDNTITIYQVGDVFTEPFTEKVSAKDAQFTINGIATTSTSNTVSDVIPGVTFTLKKADPAGLSATITVASDPSGAKTKIESFVNAYNDIVNYLNSNTDATQGESSSRSIINKLRSVMTRSITGPSHNIGTLSSIGITTNKDDGTLVIDSSKLGEKLSSNYDDVKNLFANTNDGIARQIFSYTDKVTSSVDGAITIRQKGLKSVVDRLTKQISDMNDRLTKVEADYKRQFASLETLIGSMQSQGSYLSSLTSSK